MSKFENWALAGICFLLVLLIVINSNPVSYIANDNISAIIVSPLESNGAIPINIQDQHTEIIDLFVSKIIDTITITKNTSIDDTIISINSVTLPLVGNLVCFKEQTAFYQGTILNVVNTGGNNYNITLDTPLDFPFTINGGCSLRNEDLAVDGSVTPQIFIITPSNTTADWDITRLIFHIEDNVAMDSGKFGGIPALNNGIYVRVVNSVTKNIFNIKTNGDFAHRTYDIAYDDKAPAGVYAFRSRSTFAGQDKRGVTIRLNYKTGDELQVVVQDDLTDLDHFHVIAQGHIVTD